MASYPQGATAEIAGWGSRALTSNSSLVRAIAAELLFGPVLPPPASTLILGATDVTALYVGSTPVTAAYLGSVQVFGP